jgi:hypothetical protein
MMLTYLDTWWNEDIIPEKYEMYGTSRSSPGIWSNLPASEDGFSEYKTNNGQYDYMLQLFDDVYKPEKLYTSQVLNGSIPARIDAALSKLDLKDILDFSSSSLNENEIKSYINNGIPVMICIQDHAIVAFAYDEDKDVYYAHNGYSDSSGVPRLISISPSQIKYAFVVMPTDDSTHVCSNNYSKSSSYGTDFCPCYLDGHPHISEHTYTYTSSNHTEYCCEKAIKTGTHAVATCEKNNSSVHTLFCKCGYNINQSHWYYYPKVLGVGYTQHWLECVVCQTTWYENHFSCYYSEKSNGKYQIYCYCTYPLSTVDELPSGLYPLPT